MSAQDLQRSVNANLGFTLRIVRKLRVCNKITDTQILQVFTGWAGHYLHSKNLSGFQWLISSIHLFTGLKEKYISDFFMQCLFPNEDMSSLPQKQTSSSNAIILLSSEDEWCSDAYYESSLNSENFLQEVKMNQVQLWVRGSTSNLPQWEYLDTTDYSRIPAQTPESLQLCECSGPNSLCRGNCVCAQGFRKQFKVHPPLLKYRDYVQMLHRAPCSIVECSEACRCNKAVCCLVAFPLQPRRRLYLQRVDSMWRVFTSEAILPGEVLLEYAGVLRQASEKPQSSLHYKKNGKTNQMSEGLQLSEEFYLDTRKSNLSRFIPESKSPNLENLRVYSYTGSQFICRLVLFATQRIQPHEQLTRSELISE